MNARGRVARRVALLALLLVGGCAALPPASTRDSLAYALGDDGTPLTRHAPVIVPEYPGPDYNRIGRPVAEFDARGRERVRVDPDAPAVFVQRLAFETARGNHYTNLVYRIHFERVPYRLVPFHLSAGRNAGLLVIVTLDSGERPVLFTTVHTCGCYLAMVPTSHLPRTAWPPDRDAAGQRVFGIDLPGVLDYPDGAVLRPVVFLKHGTHRVRRIELSSPERIAREFSIEVPEVLPMSALETLPLPDGGTTSFFHDTGLRRGYVKGATKPFELLFMSWWALDLNVGVDKAFGDREETGTIFYTSLKPWRRSDSDMWRFAEFLEYWGWRL